MTTREKLFILLEILFTVAARRALIALYLYPKIGTTVVCQPSVTYGVGTDEVPCSKMALFKYFRAMGKNKLKRFAESETFSNMIQPDREDTMRGLPLKGHWGEKHFKNDKPIVLELGCGHGDYTVGLARLFPEKNFIGIDIKGARMWRGAKTALAEGLTNAAFLRTEIELIAHCFAENEVAEIWITFPDPQIKFKRAKHRLVHPTFLDTYAQILSSGGKIHLKTDSEFLHGYASGVAQLRGYHVHEAYYDIHLQLRHLPEHVLFTIKTFYEKMWLAQGKAISYLCFSVK